MAKKKKKNKVPKRRNWLAVWAHFRKAWWMYPWEPSGFYDPHIIPDLGIVINIFDHAITHEWDYPACWVGVYIFKSPYGHTGYFEDTHYKFRKI